MTVIAASRFLQAAGPRPAAAIVASGARPPRGESTSLPACLSTDRRATSTAARSSRGSPSHPSARDPVSASSASGHGRDSPIDSIAFRRRAGLLALVDRAAVQRQRAAGDLRQRAVELELQDVGEEVARVRRVVRHVILRARDRRTPRRAPTAARRPDTSAAGPTTPCCSRPASISPENTFQRH